MTRTLGVMAALVTVATFGCFVVGLAGSAPAPLMLGFLCGVPGTALLMGAALGRASNEFQVVRKDNPVVMNSRQPGIERRREREPLT